MRKRGRETSMCGCLLRAPTGELAHNPGMGPDWELNQQPFALPDNAQPTEPQQSGPSLGFLVGNHHNLVGRERTRKVPAPLQYWRVSPSVTGIPPTPGHAQGSYIQVLRLLHFLYYSYPPPIFYLPFMLLSPCTFSPILPPLPPH